MSCRRKVSGYREAAWRLRGLNAKLVRQWRVGRGMGRARDAAAALADDAGTKLKVIDSAAPAFASEAGGGDQLTEARCATAAVLADAIARLFR